MTSHVSEQESKREGGERERERERGREKIIMVEIAGGEGGAER